MKTKNEIIAEIVGATRWTDAEKAANIARATRRTTKPTAQAIYSSYIKDTEHALFYALILCA